MRGKRYKYAVYYDEPSGPYECLYDLSKDPTELNNLAANPEVASVLEKMKMRMNHYLSTYPQADSMRSIEAQKSGKLKK